jgi:hypothetical protein
MTPQHSSKIKQPQSADSKKRKRKSQIGHTSPKGLRQGLNKLLNAILVCDDPLSHAGQYASLANAMTNSQKFSFDINDFRKLQAEVEKLKDMMEKKDESQGS